MSAIEEKADKIECTDNELVSHHSISNHHEEQVTWKMKTLVLLCLFLLPGKNNTIYYLVLAYKIHIVGCHYLEATVGTLKTTLKQVINVLSSLYLC